MVPFEDTSRPPERSVRRGIVRTARRPSGWSPPGPRPAGPGDDPALWPAAGEDLCFLTGDFRIFQRLDGHRWSLDDLVTAWYALQVTRGRPIARAADLGCGIGSVLQMIAWGRPDTRCVGVEAQEISADLAARSVRYNGLAARVEVRHGDLRDPAMVREGPVFDLVTGTPPYIPVGHGTISERVQCGPCRHELRGGVEDYLTAGARLLSPEAPMVICQDARQVERVEAAAAAAGLCVASRRDVIPRAGRAPLFSVYALRQDARSAIVEAPLVVRDDAGAPTAAYQALRRDMGMPPTR